VTVAELYGNWGQDTFVYREKAGIKSIMLDDNKCDCHSSISAGHGMCADAASSDRTDSQLWGNNGDLTATAIGVDTLGDNFCTVPKESRKLQFFFRSKAAPPCVLPMCAAPAYGCSWSGGVDTNGCPTCGQLVCANSNDRR